MSEFPLPSGPSSPSRRNVAIAAGVVLFHVAALWALQTGLLRRAAELVVPVEIMSEIITPPAPRVEPQPAPPPPQPAVAHKAAPPPPAPKLAAAPQLPPAPAAPTGIVEAQPAPPPITAPVAETPAAPAPPPPAPARVELPSSSADYLQNPKPVYPPISKRLGEQGKVLVHVLIGADGSAQSANLKQSSGYDRLDNAALETVRKWRYVPGKRGGVPEAMWFDVPVHFVLE
jgi:protein TonB